MTGTSAIIAAFGLLVAIIGLVAFVLFVPGKSGRCLVDHIYDWCRNNLPW